MRKLSYSVIAATGLVCALAPQAAFGSGRVPSSAQRKSSGPAVTITVNCEPPTSQPGLRSDFVADIKGFEKLHPNITIVPHDENPCDNPQTFDAKLAGDQEENVFYVYLTDAQQVINSGQAADIKKYLPANDENISDIQSSVLNVFRGKNGDLYGLPKTNYTFGLLYNRKLFSEAGLNPNNPPTTWPEVAADAQKISALGHNIVGYADYSASNQGGWHFTGELYSQGGAMVSQNGKNASFDSPQGMQVLKNLYNMRWVDNVMGTTQLLTIPTVQQMMGANQLGMYVSAPDNIPQIVQSYGGSYANLAMGPLPGQTGPAKATLLGGDGYLFAKRDTPAQIKAGIEFLQFENLTPGKGQFNYQRSEAQKQPVGLPEPNLWTGAMATANLAAKKAYTNEPIANFDKFQQAMLTMKSLVEPPDAQQIYSVMDNVMSAVLTNKGANLEQLLASSAGAVNSLLAASKS